LDMHFIIGISPTLEFAHHKQTHLKLDAKTCQFAVVTYTK